MYDYSELYQAARLILERCGATAGEYAAERANFFLNNGDLEGSIAWQQILGVIRRLMSPAESDEFLN